MKFISFLTAFLVMAVSGFGQINFHTGSFETIQKMAQEEELPIFVDVYTTWCGPCKWLSANHFQDEGVGSHFNQNFISFKIDAEKGEGIAFAEKYGVRAYPTLLFLDAEGNLLHKGVGAPEDNQALISLAEAALAPETQLYSLKKRYEEGETDIELLKNYVRALNQAYEDASEPAEKLFGEGNPIPFEALQDPENWKLFSQSITDINSPLYRKVLEMKDELQEWHPDEFPQYTNAVEMQALRGLLSSEDVDPVMFENLKMKIQEIYLEDAEEVVAKFNYYYYAREEGQAHGYALEYFDNFPVDWNTLNQVAWNYYRTKEDPEQLKDALRWVEKSIEQDKNWYNVDTKAHLLYKLKQKAEAREAAEEAIELGKQAEEDVSETEALLKKIKALK